MKTKIIRTLIILIAILPSLASFRYLDHECVFLGRSILDKEHTLNSIGIGVSLYTGCPGSIEFTDKRNGDICCYFSWIPNIKCTPQPSKETRLLYYIICDTHLLLCENDSAGERHFKKLIRGSNSMIQAEDIDGINLEGQNSKIVFADVADCEKKIDARDCCLHIVVLLVLLLVIEIVDIACALLKRQGIIKQNRTKYM